MVWDRGYWDCEDPDRAYGEGKLDLTLEGEKLHGGWILNRMRKREGEKRTNWLLIKHRDEFAREGKRNRILDEDTSVASGRSMDEIAAGKGRGPRPFFTMKRSRAPAKAEWKSHRASARAPSAKKRSDPVAAPTGRSAKKNASEKGDVVRSNHAPFVAPQLCKRLRGGSGIFAFIAPALASICFPIQPLTIIRSRRIQLGERAATQAKNAVEDGINKVADAANKKLVRCCRPSSVS
jgi:ATP-dependent DNA ligase